jgi:small subunit ribosomal protein S3
MEERKTVALKKEEFAIKEYVKNTLGKGKISRIKIDYTPVGEKIIVSTSKPGLVIGRGGENIKNLTEIMKTQFKLENPHIEIDEIQNPDFDSQLVADDIALSLEKLGPLKFKVVAYRALQKIINAGAQGVEIRLSGKLPSSRAKSWRFAQGYLKKTGDSAKIVDRAQALAQTKPGTVGIKVSILSPDKKLLDRMYITDKLMDELKSNSEEKPIEEKVNKKTLKQNSRSRPRKIENETARKKK